TITPFDRHRRRAGELPQRRLDRGTPKDVRPVPARGWRSGRRPLWSHPGMRWLPPRNTGARDVLVAGAELTTFGLRGRNGQTNFQNPSPLLRFSGDRSVSTPTRFP